MEGAWSLDELRSAAARLGVEPDDDDLARVLAFLEVLGPDLDEVERLVPPGTVPAGLFLPADPA